MRAIAVGLLLTLVGAAAAQPKKWVPYKFETEGYLARFPEKPTPESKELATAAGVVRMTTVRAGLGRDLELAVTVATYPSEFKELAAKGLLDGVRDGLKGSDGVVLSDESVTLDSAGATLGGREVQVAAGRSLIRCRAFLVGNKLYQVMATGSKAAVGGPIAEQFFGSFELLAEK